MTQLMPPHSLERRACFATGGSRIRLLIAALVLPAGMAVLSPRTIAEAADSVEKPVSYYKDIRPIFQAHCQGCHQPAKQGGEYVMTDFARLVAGGESGEAAISPEHPEESSLLGLITPTEGAAEMPKGAKPLAETDIELIRNWIAQGADDDTPANARQRYDQDHPPVYSRPPIITSLEYAPDGELLAVSGFHEVLLHKADGTGLVARLIGLSERIESIAFSPDGKRLAVTGGLPERMGELQIWDLSEESADSQPSTLNPQLALSVPLTYDTLYGASWSPDGTVVAVGCTDNTVRGLNAQTGEQVFFNGTHDDWALDTVFSVDGSHLVSVGRDMTTKLYNVPTQRFIDNVTSITPGALRGGIGAVARHPLRDEVLVGGSDGTPRIYRMHRETKRVIGDDANLVRRFPPMRGRIHSVAFAPDGKTIASGSSLDGQGQVFVYSSDYNSALTDEFKKILAKLPGSWSAEERKQVDQFVTAGADVIAKTEIPSGIYAVAFSADGKTVAAAGADGTIRFINTADGTVIREWQPVDVDPDAPRSEATLAVEEASEELDSLSANESLPEGRTLAGLDVEPSAVILNGPYAYAQLLVTGVLDTGERVDVTRMANYTLPEEAGQVTRFGRVTARQDGYAALVVQVGEQVAGVPIEARGIAAQTPVSFVRDVMPVLSRQGCNAGTCHGSKDGKEGFKLSLRGYDPVYDVRAFTDEMKARRINLASPDDSLMLLKATGAVPHIGGAPTHPGSDYYEIMRRWIVSGAELDLDVPRVASIDIAPKNPVVQQIGARQQMRVVATYSDGSTRDVTAEAFLDSGNTDVAAVNSGGIVTALRRGEAPVLARYEGAYAATTVTAMGDRSGFEWKQPESWNRIDELVADKWERMKILPSDLCTDDEFLRRVFLDLTGLPPTIDHVQAFLADERETRVKRTELIDRLIGSDDYITYWTNKWADLLQVNSKFLGQEGATAFRDWIRTQVEQNTPYDQFCRELLTANGSNKDNPAASYYKILREPDAIMENTTHLFLGVRFNCNKCHDHPFERWTQDQYYETAAFFARVGLKKDEASGKKTIGGTAVEGAKPLYEVVFEKDSGEVTHEKTGAVTAPEFPFEAEVNAAADASRRDRLAVWITSPDNQYFARSYVNRVWGYLMGTGIIEPLDDIRAGNPPTNPELLDYLAEQFVESGFNVRELIRGIVNSRTYQLSVATNEWNADDALNYSHAQARRLPAEVLYDAIYTVTGAKMKIPGVPEGTRAAALADAAANLPDGFLDNLGRPARESACECERSSELQLGPVMSLMNGQTVNDAITDPESAIARLIAENQDNADVINQVFLRILNRPARPQEIASTLEIGADMASAHQDLVARLDAYRKQIAPELARREKAREEAIAVAKADLEAYEAQIAQREAELDRKQQEETERLAAELAEFDDKPLQEAFQKFQDEYQRTVTWVPLDPKELTTNTETKLTKLPDLSVLGSQRGTSFAFYVFKADTTLSRITGVKLEVLTHETLPLFGPGFAENANFVLNEVRASWAPLDAPGSATPFKFGSAQATVSQDGEYAVEEVINGNREEINEGWQIHPEYGKDHAAVLTLKEPIKLNDPAELTFILEQVFLARDHTIGRFRISVTDAPEPTDYGVPREIDQILAIAAGARSDEQKETLLSWFKGRFQDRRKIELALNKSRLPRGPDPDLVARQTRLEAESRPLPQDPQLARLERAVELSEKQLKDIRTTMAQDLAWALINSPAFLFNR